VPVEFYPLTHSFHRSIYSLATGFKLNIGSVFQSVGLAICGMGKNIYFAVTMKTPVSFLLLIVCTTAFAQPAMLEKELDDIYLSNNIYEVLTAN
jgi:hypothetical protein